MAKAQKPVQKTVYQLKVILAGNSPMIWRRIQVPGKTRLPALHLILQAAMGWYNCHLHSFSIQGVDYSEPDPGLDDLDYEDETKVRLNQIASRAGIRFGYMYDFGDGWEHDILVEEILTPQRGVKYPICLAGKRACPPEDVGGVWGYEEFLEAIKNPKHEEHEDYLEWVGGEFDPDEFDVEQTNGVMQDYRMLDLRNL